MAVGHLVRRHVGFLEATLALLVAVGLLLPFLRIPGEHSTRIAVRFQTADMPQPGGFTVHTTEFNVSSNDETLVDGHTVLYRRRDLEDLVMHMRAAGHEMRITFASGSAPEDLHVDSVPYTNLHLRVFTEGFVHTSFGLIIRRGHRAA